MTFNCGSVICAAVLASACTTQRDSLDPDAPSATYVMADNDGIFTLDANATNRNNLRAGITPSWTPNGRIVFSDGTQVWIMEADGSNAQLLASPPTKNVMFPQMAGGKIVFTGADHPESGVPDVWIMDADGTNAQKIVPAAGPTSLSPDGTWVAYTVQSAPEPGETVPYHREVWRAATDGTQQQQLTFTGDPDYPDANAPSISPDGRWVAVFSGKESVNDPQHPDDPSTWGYRNVALVPADGGARQLVTNVVPLSVDPESVAIAADNPAWSPDGKEIIYDRGSPNADASGEWIIGIDSNGNRRLWPQTRGAGKVPMH